MALNVIMLGPPASGKGTQAVRLAQARGIPKISTGDMLREAVRTGSELGRRARALMDHGELIGDEEMVGIVRERLSQPDAVDGFILDGFPRTVPQAHALDRLLQGQPLVVVDLAVPDSELIRRMQGRRVCSRCAANSGPDDPSPQSQDRCVGCGGEMMRRADDADEQVRQHRLVVYARDSKPLLDYYRARPTFRSVNGAQTPDQVARDVASGIISVEPVASGLHQRQQGAGTESGRAR
jgi:adenylate kinase